MVPKVKLTNSYLTGLAGQQITKNVSARDSASNGLLAIRYAKTGLISFVYIGRIKGAGKRENTIGRYPETSIEEARIRASELRKLYRQGIDPKQLEEQQAAERERKRALEEALKVPLRTVLERYF